MAMGLGWWCLNKIKNQKIMMRAGTNVPAFLWHQGDTRGDIQGDIQGVFQGVILNHTTD